MIIRVRSYATIIAVTIGVLFLFQNCGTGFGNPNFTTDVDLAFSPFHKNIDKFDKSKDKEIEKEKEFQGPIKIKDLYLCIKKVKFTPKAVFSETLIEDEDFPIGEIELLPQGTPLGTLEITQYLYDKIEVHLDGKDCESGNAISFKNRFGEFSYQKGIKLKYEGDILVDDKLEAIGLEVHPIINALKNIKEDKGIKKAIEAAFLEAVGEAANSCDGKKKKGKKGKKDDCK
jgi:hypothetical protein